MPDISRSRTNLKSRMLDQHHISSSSYWSVTSSDGIVKAWITDVSTWWMYIHGCIVILGCASCRWCSVGIQRRSVCVGARRLRFPYGTSVRSWLLAGRSRVNAGFQQAAQCDTLSGRVRQVLRVGILYACQLCHAKKVLFSASVRLPVCLGVCLKMAYFDEAM